jgi:hypothetical protein
VTFVVEGRADATPDQLPATIIPSALATPADTPYIVPALITDLPVSGLDARFVKIAR